MTKKDYIKLAAALKDSKPETINGYDDGYHNQLVRWNVTCENIAHVLAWDNSRFDRNRFMKACGYTE